MTELVQALGTGLKVDWPGQVLALVVRLCYLVDWEADQLKGMVHSGLGWLLMAQGLEVPPSPVRVLHYLVEVQGEVQPLIGLAQVDC